MLAKRKQSARGWYVAKSPRFAARVHITRLAPPDPAIDLATGQGEVPLAHPEALVSADCGALSCELEPYGYHWFGSREGV